MPESLEGLERGDLVFWKGHVGIMADGLMLVHANAHHMAVVVETLPEAAERIARQGSKITSIKRLPALSAGHGQSPKRGTSEPASGDREGSGGRAAPLLRAGTAEAKSSMVRPSRQTDPSASVTMVSTARSAPVAQALPAALDDVAGCDRLEQRQEEVE